MSIFCWFYRRKLSQHIDGACSEGLQAMLGRHLLGCADCAGEVDRLKSVSLRLRDAAKRIPDLEPFKRAMIRQRIETEGWEESAARLSPAAVFGRRPLLAAAGILVVFALSWSLGRWSAIPPAAQKASTAHPFLLNAGLLMDEYVKPEVWSDRLFAKAYAAEAIDPQEAARQVDFTPSALNELPESYSMTNCYLIKTACCRGVQYRYRRGSDQVDLLEHAADHPVSFGSRRGRTSYIAGRPVEVYQNGDAACAVAWKQAGRINVLVGKSSKDVVEIAERLLAAASTPDRKLNK